MGSKSVLAISDDCNLRQTARAFLERRGFRVTTASSALEAQRMTKWGTDPCVILVDTATMSADAVRTTCGDGHVVVEMPTRTSSSGVRRLAKRGAQLEALETLLKAHCAPTTLAA